MSSLSLPPEILRLPITDRLVLVEQIWNSIVDDEQAFQLSDAQKSELDRRLQAREISPERGATWDEVKKRLLEGS